MSNFVMANGQLEVAAGDTYSIANGDPLAVDFTDILGSATISSVTSITPDPVTGLTLSNAAANLAEFTRDGITVAAGKAIVFDKAAGSTARTYLVRTVVTLSTGSKRDAEFRIVVK